MYIPKMDVRVPFRIYNSINNGYLGDFLGIEFPSIALVDTIISNMNDFFIDNGFFIIGSRNLLTSVENYNKIKSNSLTKDIMGEYNDINIFSFPVNNDYFDVLYTSLLSIEEIIKQAFGVKIINIMRTDDTTPSVYFSMLGLDINELNSKKYINNFKSQDGAFIFYNIVLSTFYTFFDVYVYFKNTEDRLLQDQYDISYVAYFKNFVFLENFKYKFLSELYTRLKINMKDDFLEDCKIVKLCEKYLSMWETGS
jgi:hypothetical protein